MLLALAMTEAALVPCALGQTPDIAPEASARVQELMLKQLIARVNYTSAENPFGAKVLPMSPE
jgi:hypothetical protein